MLNANQAREKVEKELKEQQVASHASIANQNKSDNEWIKKNLIAETKKHLEAIEVMILKAMELKEFTVIYHGILGSEYNLMQRVAKTVAKELRKNDYAVSIRPDSYEVPRLGFAPAVIERVVMTIEF